MKYIKGSFLWPIFNEAFDHKHSNANVHSIKTTVADNVWPMFNEVHR